MKIKISLFVLLFDLVSIAQSNVRCPFKAIDVNAIDLADSAKTAILDLLDSKNECTDQVIESVKSVQGLPDLINNLKDPLSESRSTLEYIKIEIARESTKPNSNINRIQELFDQKIELERQIDRSKLDRSYTEREAAKEKAAIMAQNLMSTFSSILKDPSSKCAKTIAHKNGSTLLNVGLTILAAGSPLIYASAASAAAAAQTLSNTVSLFNSLPPQSLQSFYNDESTIDMACLYFSTVQLSCSQEEQILQSNSSDSAISNLTQMANCLPDYKVFRDMYE